LPIEKEVEMREMNVLSVSVHPDDETLGCGATLLKNSAGGNALHWLLVTAAVPPEYSKAQITAQRRQIQAVRDAYPFEQLHWLKLPTTRLESIPLNQIVGRIRDVVEQVRPHTVYVPHRGDVHSDHRVVHEAVMAVTKSFHMRKYGIRRVLACEVLSETDAAYPEVGRAFLPNVLVDVTATFERKIEIFGLFKTETQQGSLPRHESALRALARLRGASIGVEYAEAFMLLREIVA
jgi:N-acetylglucosamine malate deacetylase 1